MTVIHDRCVFLLLQALACAMLLVCECAAQTQGASPSSQEGRDGEIEEALLPAPEPWIGDFDGMQERRRIRILVPFSRTFFFIDQADKRGTVHDLGKAFEQWLNKKYKTKALRISVVFIPTSRDRLIPALMEGLGDIAAANLTITPERKKLVDFSMPWLEKVKEVVVTGPSAPALAEISDLGGKEVYVRASSSYSEHLVRLNKKLKKKVKLKPADEDLEDEDLLEMVNAGLLPFAVVDDHKAKLWAKVFDKIKVRNDLVVNEEGKIAWAVRKNTPLLLGEINRFLREFVKKTGFGEEVFRRYLRSTKHVRNATSRQEIKKFDKLVSLFKQYGDVYNFDHLMLIGQGYQESRLDQSAVSPRGAVGILQVLPSTAENPPISIPEVDKSTENNIHAGVKYLRWLVDTQLNDPAIDGKNRMLMAFAGYNAGPGNLRRFRRLAERSNLNPNVWFQNVEHAAARIVGRETVQYVSNIHKYYIAYKLTEERRVAREKARSTKSKK